jgi:hypothetical protein
MVRNWAQAAAVAASNAMAARALVMAEQENGGESGTRTPDTRIMIPLL